MSLQTAGECGETGENGHGSQSTAGALLKIYEVRLAWNSLFCLAQVYFLVSQLRRQPGIKGQRAATVSNTLQHTEERCQDSVQEHWDSTPNALGTIPNTGKKKCQG